MECVVLHQFGVSGHQVSDQHEQDVVMGSKFRCKKAFIRDWASWLSASSLLVALAILRFVVRGMRGWRTSKRVVGRSVVEECVPSSYRSPRND